MQVLGLSCYYHDSAAALVRDGIIVAAAQEERFTRKKHDAAFPRHAAAFCLQEGGIKASDLDMVVFYDKPLLKFERILETYLHCAPRGLASFLKAMPVWVKEKLWIPMDIRKQLEFDGPIRFTEHHMSHAASAFFPSPFTDAVIITADGVGEWATSSIGIGQGNQVRLVKEIHFPHSIGLLYSAFTYYTGFRVNSGEYKLMGLAPYGDGRYTQRILDHLIDIREDGSFRLNMDYFNYLSGLTMTSSAFHDLFEGPPRPPESDITRKEMDLAKSIQEVTEMVMERMVRHAMEVTGLKRVCLAGGVALNCVANGGLMQTLPLEDVFIQPAASDAGGALGAALFGYHQILKAPRAVDGKMDSQQGSLLGPAYTSETIQSYLQSHAIPYRRLEQNELPDRVAALLAAEAVVGLFQGRMEFGPRALGSRSILGDPRSPHMQKIMNLKIKFRESFRPFAPILLEEERKALFDCPFPSPYMLSVGRVRPEHRVPLTPEQEGLFGIDRLNVPRSHLPAITHVDYSARLQTVTAESHPFCYQLLRAFKKQTGVGVLVNTSFNVRGEPIVCTPDEAYRCFMRTQMDYLVLENFLLDKKKQPLLSEQEKNLQEEFELD